MESLMIPGGNQEGFEMNKLDAFPIVVSGI
jgi:hypothetical protein